ncbi:MAG TPA: VOC family protein [Candidatus Saccharimonadales bacterium]|nr:VOC family protein [Candidatus Saccharimonadales bacterium]
MNEFVKQQRPEVPMRKLLARGANVSLGVNNLGCMKKFYQEVLGFELLGEFPSAALLKAREGCGTTAQKLGLLQRSDGIGRGIEHVVFVMPVQNPELERKRLEGLGLKVAAVYLDGVESDLLSFRDPEGNEIELLCCGTRLKS